MVVSVDLPIPGEPPSSTSAPGTSPPPSTRSSSPMPVVQPRVPLRGDLREPRRACPPPPRGARRRAPPATALARVSSTSVFHSPQPGHWPIQRGVSAAQAEQMKTVVGRAMSVTVGPGADVLAPLVRCVAGLSG